MADNTSITLTGFDEAAAQALAACFAAAIRNAVESVRERLRARFASEGQLFGAPWRPAAKPQSWPLLQKTRRLRESFLDPHHPEHVEVTDEGTENQQPGILFGSSVPYAAYHQFGTSRMPARTILTPELLGGIEQKQPQLHEPEPNFNLHEPSTLSA